MSQAAPAISFQCLPRVQRYLLPEEGAVIVTRLHWAVVAEPAAMLAFAVLVYALTSASTHLRALAPVILVVAGALTLRATWHLVEHRHRWFVVTDQRLLLVYGVLTRKIAVMPLSKVTDMTYNRSLLGRALGFGEFVFESAGQDQALHAISYLGRSDTLFTALSNQLFGTRGIVSTRPERPRPERPRPR